MSIAIPNIVFVIFLAIATGYLTFLTAKGGLTDNRFSTFWKRITKRGRKVLYVLVMILILLVCQEWNSQNDSKRQNALIEKERNQRDSIITAGIKSGVDYNSKKLFEDISKAFAKQELTLDTVNKTIVKIRESKNKIVTIYNQPDPIIRIDTNGILIIRKKGSKSYYTIAFRSYDAGATNIDAMAYIVFEYSSGEKGYISKRNFFSKNFKITKDGAWSTGFDINSIQDISYIFVFFKGLYTNLDGTKKFSIEDLYRFNTKTNKTDIVLDFAKGNIIEIIPKNEFVR